MNWAISVWRLPLKARGRPAGSPRSLLTDRIVRTAYVDFITGTPRKNPQPNRPFPDHYYVTVTPEGKIQLRSKSALDLWREAHPEEAVIYNQKAYEQVIQSQKNIGIGFRIMSNIYEQQEKERLERERRAKGLNP